MPELRQEDLLRLLNIGQAIGKGVGAIGKAISPKEQLSSAADILGQLIGLSKGMEEHKTVTAKAQQVGQAQQPQQSQQAQTPQEQSMEQFQPTDPIQETRVGEIKKIGKEQIREAAQHGVPLEQLLAQTMQPTLRQRFEGLNPLGRAREAFSSALLAPIEQQEAQTNAQIMQILLGQQELLGQKPLQKGERELAKLEFANKLALELNKAGSVDALTPENAGKFNLLIDGLNATNDISNMLNSNITAQMFAQGVPSFLKSQDAKILQAAIERSVQAKTRIETGAALQPSELKSTSKRFMPQKGDTITTALRRLKPLSDYFQGSINVADPTGIHRQRATGIVAQRAAGNISQEQITAARQKGATGFDTSKGVFVDAQGREIR